MDDGGRRLVRIGRYTINHGRSISVIEGENIIFMLKYEKKVLALLQYSSLDEGKVLIIERV